MKKSLYLGGALAISMVWLNASWIRTESSTAAGQETSLSSLGSLSSETGSTFSGSESSSGSTGKSSLSSLATGGSDVAKAAGGHWKDAPSGQTGDLTLGGDVFEPKQVPEASTWAAGFAVSALLLVRYFNRK